MRSTRLMTLLVVVHVMAWAGRCTAAQRRIYWGDVHGHTALSDGKGSLDDYFIYARDVAKLDFVIVTDHDFGNGPPWRMPKKAWQRTQEKAAQYTQNGKFVAIAGYEWTSQAKYWSGVGDNIVSEHLFAGPPKFYNHKNVYFLNPVDYLFSAKNPAYRTPDLLAEAVRKVGGLVQNNHPAAGPDGRDQWDYSPVYYPVIANTEMYADTLYYQGKTYHVNMEKAVRSFLDRGGRTGFVRGTDTHEGHPAARTAVLAKELTRAAIFDALRHRHNYAVSNARIVLRFQIDGHAMGEAIQTTGKPKIVLDVRGTDTISEVAIVCNGSILHSFNPVADHVTFQYVDNAFTRDSYYYLRVTQVDKDEHGNPSRAWSTPIWVSRKPSTGSGR